MSMKANDYKSGGGDFTPVDPLEPGSYPARVVAIANIGLQAQQAFKGTEKAPKHEFRVTYELLDEFLKDEDGNDDEDKPRWVSERFSINPLSSENAKSTARYLALDPTNKHAGDWSQLLGTPLILDLLQNRSKKNPERVYSNVRTVTAMRPKDVKNAAELKNDPILFDFYEPDVKVFLALPKFIQEEIKSSLDFDGSKLAEMLEDVSEADTTKEEKKTKSKPKEEASDNEDDDSEW